MTRQEVEQMCREFATERGWVFESRDHYPLLDHAHDEGEDEDGAAGPCMCRSPLADGYELNLETNAPLPDRYMSTIVIGEKVKDYVDTLVPRWLEICASSLKEKT